MYFYLSPYFLLPKLYNPTRLFSFFNILTSITLKLLTTPTQPSIKQENSQTIFLTTPHIQLITISPFNNTKINFNMLFSSYLTLALPMASVVCGEVTESLFRSRVSRALQHQELPRKAMSVSSMMPLILDTLDVVSTPVQNGTNHTVSFGVTDPNSNSSTSCSNTWTQSTSGSNNYPSAYIQCPTSNASFEHWQWYFEVYTSFSSFTLRLDHTYTDNDVGKAPYNKLSTFSRASANLTCETDSTTNLKTPCTLNNQDNTVAAPVWGLSA